MGSIVLVSHDLAFSAEVGATRVLRFFFLTNMASVATITAATVTAATVMRVKLGGFWEVGGVTGSPVTLTQALLIAGVVKW